MIKQLPEILQAARLVLVQKRPYLAAIVWALIPVEREGKTGLDSMAVDAWGRWYINIEEVTTWPLAKIVLALIHEINHLLRRHHDRMLTFSEWFVPGGISLSNIAGDMEINDDLKEDATDFNTELPPEWIYPKNYGYKDGLFAEEYCEKLLRQAQQNKQCYHVQMQQGQQQQQGQGSGQDQQGQGKDNKGKGQGKDKGQQGQGSGKGQQAPGKGSCGSCSGSGHQPWEEDAPKGSGKDGSGTSDVPGLSAPEVEVLRRQVAVAIKQHSSSRGTVPGGLKRWADCELEPPKVHWTKELAAIIRRTQADLQGMVDYSWKKISKRSTDEILLPGLRRPKIEIVGVIDTSGSMSDNDLSACLREFSGVLKVVGLEGMKFIAVDAAAHVSGRVFKPSQIILQGGGGTDMRVGIDAAVALKPRPDAVIVFTDGETPWPDEAPKDAKVIAVLVRGKPGHGDPPSWIRSLYVED